MPHYQEVLRVDNGLDAKFVTCMKLLQIGELYLDSSSQELRDRFSTLFLRAIPIIETSLTDQSPLQVGNDFYVWFVPESFSGNNVLVRLYRFA